MTTHHPRYTEFKADYRKTLKRIQIEIVFERIIAAVFCILVAIAILSEAVVRLDLLVVILFACVSTRNVHRLTLLRLQMEKGTIVLAELINADSNHSDWYFRYHALDADKSVSLCAEGIRLTRRQVLCARMYAKIRGTEIPDDLEKSRLGIQDLFRRQQLATL